MDQRHKHNKTFKIVLLGETCVGKTCLVRTYTNGAFKENTNRIVGGDFFNKKLKIHNIIVELLIGVVAGQERYRSLVPIYAKNSDGILLLYDIADKNTFKTLREWCETVKEITPDAIIFIVGAKSDLLEEKEVSRDIGEKFAKKENLEFFECSARTCENVHRVFEQMTLRILQKKGLIPSEIIETEKNQPEWKETRKLPATTDTKNNTSEQHTSSAAESSISQKDIQVSSEEGKEVNTSEINDNRHSLNEKKNVLPKLELSEEEMLSVGKCCLNIETAKH